MTIAAEGRVQMTNPRAAQLRDLTNKQVQAEIRAQARKDVEASRERRLRAAERAQRTN
jgi:hypothetical protein